MASNDDGGKKIDRPKISINSQQPHGSGAFSAQPDGSPTFLLKPVDMQVTPPPKPPKKP